MMRLHRDQRGISGSLLFVIIIVALLGVVIIDGGSIVFGKVQLQDLADLAASDAANAYKGNHNELAACQTAERTIATRDKDASIVGGCEGKASKFFAVPETEAVSLVIHKTASTIFVSRIGPLKSMAEMTATGHATPSVL